MGSSQLYVQIAIWSQVASALLFIAAMAFVWMRWLQPMVLAAQARSNRQISEAERHRDEAKAAVEALRDEIEGATRDAELIRRRADGQAVREREVVVAEATVACERVLHNAAGELERAREAARLRLRDEILARALAQARDQAQRSIDGAANARLVERFLVTLESARGEA
ncbi:MAG TPA: hypothetical protein VMV82_08845 [Candidatus Dormibacteraeota bacterium]|nr:hypothetical protein [Candidatus Dormibacteraeota bacterium]